MILKRNDEVISRNGTFKGIVNDLVWLGFERDIITWVEMVEKSQPGTASSHEYRRLNGDLWSLNRENYPRRMLGDN